MFTLKPKSLTSALIFIGTSFFSFLALGLDCQVTKTVVSNFLQNHYSQDTFDDNLSQKTFENLIKYWDSRKLYFLKTDVDMLRKKYAKQLDEEIKSATCGTAIREITKLYSKRFEEWHKVIPELIEAKHDFSIDEKYFFDTKKIQFSDRAQTKERWRKKIKSELLRLKKDEPSLKEAVEKLKNRYEVTLKQHREDGEDAIYEGFLIAFSTALDPHTLYETPEDVEDFQIRSRLSLDGIGAVLRSEDGFTVIQSLVPGGPAAKSGQIKPEDKIIEVAQGDGKPVDVKDMKLRDVVKLIRGEKGTIVKLTIVRNKEPFVVPIKREKIDLQDSRAKSRTYGLSVTERGKKKTQYKIGLLDLPSFYLDFEGHNLSKDNFTSSSQDVKKELLKLKKEGVDAVIFDLRNNGGGALIESISIAGLFIDKGPVVQVKNSDGSKKVHEDEDPGAVYSGPLVILVNRYTASASEIVSGAIQDYQRGLVIGGKHTFGKGTVQHFKDLSAEQGAIKVTVSKYYRPSGASVQLKGVESDIVLPNPFDEFERGEVFYDYALPWDKIDSSKFKKLNMTLPYIGRLAQVSKKRVESDSEYKKMLDAIKEVREKEKEGMFVSLKEEKKEEEKNKEKKDDEELKPDEFRKITDDIEMQEALRIAVDYTRLLNKKPLAEIAIPELQKLLAEQTETDKDKHKDPKK